MTISYHVFRAAERPGLQPDPAKIRDIQEMPTPQNKDELHRFIGMLTYLPTYIFKFTHKVHILSCLLKADAPWCWDKNFKKCFDGLKTIVTENACLKYYDSRTTLTLEVDASQKGLGVALVKNDQPIAFGSKTLTETQSRYSNTEREIVVGCPLALEGCRVPRCRPFSRRDVSRVTTDGWKPRILK
uniref:Reverse transcriptase/retrotransposon-derived protein RNase H-like domain-containing protein n=1 Tax=Nothobranchius furzeri TaxID=105023 RepID=A0A8C6M3H6_NOTFU